jgi:hypothetical protein
MSHRTFRRLALTSATNPARQFLAVVLISVLAYPAAAQTPSGSGQPAANAMRGLSYYWSARVRITGADAYEFPGIIKVERDHIAGIAATVTDLYVQFRAGDEGRMLTVPRPGKRLTGSARVIDGELVEFTLDKEARPLYVPLGAIARTEVLTRHTEGWSRSTQVAIWAVILGGAFLLWLHAIRGAD